MALPPDNQFGVDKVGLEDMDNDRADNHLDKVVVHLEAVAHRVVFDVVAVLQDRLEVVVVAVEVLHGN